MSLHFGRLWGKGYETRLARQIISIQGSGATSYLQNLVTSDLHTPPVPPKPEAPDAPRPGVPKRVLEQQETNTVTFRDHLRSTCFLDNKGRVVSDALLWKMNDDHYYIDCPSQTSLLSHLQQYKLRRSKVSIEDVSDDVHSHVIWGTLAGADNPPPGYQAGLDPRHPSLGLRLLQLDTTASSPSISDLVSPTLFPESPGNYELVRRLAGVAEGNELTGKVALECNQEFLNAVSFHKGCYLGQELTARVNYTGVLRKRIMPILLLDAWTEVPQPWAVASSLQEGRSRQRFTAKELKHLPTRLPRLSVLTAGNLVAISTGSIEPEREALDEEAAAELTKVQERATQLLKKIDEACESGAKLLDQQTNKTIGQVISPPVPGTNIVLAMMKLDAVGLTDQGAWSKTNKIQIGDHEFRYLPYLPLWWPELDPATGKAKEPNEDDDDDQDYDDDEDTTAAPRREASIEFEELPLHGNPNGKPSQ